MKAASYACVILTALSLLALATSASAEGIWVLWSESWLEDVKPNDPSARHTEFKMGDPGGGSFVASM